MQHFYLLTVVWDRRDKTPVDFQRIRWHID